MLLCEASFAQVFLRPASAVTDYLLREPQEQFDRDSVSCSGGGGDDDKHYNFKTRL